MTNLMIAINTKLIDQHIDGVVFNKHINIMSIASLYRDSSMFVKITYHIINIYVSLMNNTLYRVKPNGTCKLITVR